MANPHKGELAFDADGKKWTLIYSINALCEIEDELGLSINEVASMLGDAKKMRIKMVRAVLWAGLRDHHPEIDIKQAGFVVESLTLPLAVDLIGRAFVLAFPVTDAKANPQRPGAVNGTGQVSTAPGVDSGVTKKRSGVGHPAKSV